MIASQNAFAEIYKWTDKDGKVHYSDKPKDKKSKKLEIKNNSSSYSAPSNKRSAASRSVINKNKQDAFFAAIKAGLHNDILRLLDTGIDINIKDRRKQNALMYAIDYKRFKLVPLLLKHGADYAYKDNYGK